MSLQNIPIQGEDIVLWHAFGVTHIPRVEVSIKLSLDSHLNVSMKQFYSNFRVCFPITYLPSYTQDFPVMPCETTGFVLKPDGFFSGNPAIDLPPSKNKASKLESDDNDVNCCGN